MREDAYPIKLLSAQRENLEDEVLGTEGEEREEIEQKLAEVITALGLLRDSNYLKGYGKDSCGYCGIKRTPEGHDGCIGTLEGVMNACCGHGEDKTAYVQFPSGECIRGREALKYINDNKP